MRRWLICALTALASPVHASPSFADWVGDYRGSLTWRGCTAPGARMATISIDATDGVLAIDLAPAGAALRSFSLQPAERDEQIAQDGDVTVRVARTPRGIAVHVDADADARCTMHARLARSGTGVRACDRLLAWSRIEARCTKALDRHTDFAALATQKWKPRDAARCTSRADMLALAMIDAGCAPDPDPEIGTRAIACNALLEAARKLERCGRVPAAVMQPLATLAQAQAAAAQTATSATLAVVEQQCKDARTHVAAAAVQFQCQL